MVRMASCWLLIFLVMHPNEGLAENPSKQRSDAFSEFLRLIVVPQAEIERRAKRLTKLVDIAIFDSRLDPGLAKQVESGLSTVQYAIRTEESTLPALASSDFQRVTIGVNPRSIADEIDGVIKFCFASSFTDDFGVGGLPNAIEVAKDPNGPKIDVRGELVPLLGQEWILLNDATTDEIQWLIAISHKDKQRMVELLIPLLQNAPDAQRITDNHYRTAHAALAVENDWLLVGSPEFVDTATAALR